MGTLIKILKATIRRTFEKFTAKGIGGDELYETLLILIHITADPIKDWDAKEMAQAQKEGKLTMNTETTQQ